MSDLTREQIARALSRCHTFEPDVCDGCEERMNEAGRVMALFAPALKAARAEGWGKCARAVQDGLGAWDAGDHNPYETGDGR